MTSYCAVFTIFNYESPALQSSVQQKMKQKKKKKGNAEAAASSRTLSVEKGSDNETREFAT